MKFSTLRLRHISHFTAIACGDIITTITGYLPVIAIEVNSSSGQPFRLLIVLKELPRTARAGYY